MELIGELVVQCMSHNICFRAKHITSKTNVIADYISRLQEDKAKVMQPTLLVLEQDIAAIGEMLGISVNTLKRASVDFSLLLPGLLYVFMSPFARK